MPVLNFLLAIIQGALAARFTLRIVVSSVTLAFYFAGLIFSQADRSMNALGALLSLLRIAFFGALLLGTCLLAARYVAFEGWTEIATAIVYIAIVGYGVTGLRKEIVVARMRAWRPGFAERLTGIPKSLRFSFAQEYVTQGVGD